MRLVRIIVIAEMVLSTLGAAYLLWLLNRRLRTVYGSIVAWRFIFAGFVEMFVEILAGTMAVLPWSVPRPFRLAFIVSFATLMLTKVCSYVVGFSLWANQRTSMLNNHGGQLYATDRIDDSRSAEQQEIHYDDGQRGGSRGHEDWTGPAD